MEIIKSISEIENCQDSGFIVITSDQEIVLSISNLQSCCESWGYFWCNDNHEDFIGANLLNVTITDKCLVTEKLPELYEGEAMFVNLETDKGALQFVAYNEHNGYYSHFVRVISKQLQEEAYL